MADNNQDGSTVNTETEELDESTDTTTEEQDSGAPADRANAADEQDGSDGSDDDSSDQGDDEGEGSKPNKTENRSGYLIRQLTTNNPYVQALRGGLQTWVDDTDDPSERRDRQREVNDYIKDAGRAQDDIQRDNLEVAREIALFRPGAPEFDEVLTQRAFAQYARDMVIYDQNGIKDPNGNPIIIGYRMRLIDYMREKAEDYGFGSTKPANPGKATDKKTESKKSDKSKKANARMDAAADTPGGTSTAKGNGKEEKDPFLAGFDDPYGRHAPKNAHAWSE